jgi:cytochrome c-type biogenesis protein CcmH/NrfG
MSGLQQSLPTRATDAEVWLGLAYCAAILGEDRAAVAYFTRAERVDIGKARLAPYVRAAVTKSFERVGDQAPAAIPPEP